MTHTEERPFFAPHDISFSHRFNIKNMKGPIHERSHLPVQNETSPLQKMRGWKHITKSTQERSHSPAPTVKIHLFVIIHGRHMKISTQREIIYLLHLWWIIYKKSCKESKGLEVFMEESSHFLLQARQGIFAKWSIENTGSDPHQRKATCLFKMW